MYNMYTIFFFFFLDYESTEGHIDDKLFIYCNADYYK